jgi:predicted 3-demethylubiquinone-9 3-methyltransferase (glyoxalase superfamily)
MFPQKNNMQKLTPFLWFDKNILEAVDFYLSVFPGSKIVNSSHSSGTPSGDLDIVTLNILGINLTLMGAGPEFKFSEAVSFLIDCVDQAEVDYYWEKLSANPQSGECGWTKDKYGLSWQVVPQKLNELLSDPDPAAASRVMQAMLKMKKIIISDLQKAHDNIN